MGRTIANFQIKKVIGTGTFGKVREAIHKQTNEKVAIKILQKKRIADQKDLQRIQRQLLILKEINHQHILKLLQLHQTQTSIYIITQLAKGEELYERIIKQGKLTPDEACQYFVQLIQAVEYLHSKSICHRDIKPENIIVDVKTKQLKLIDFGLSNKFDKNPYMKTSCGSPCYAAPEMLTGKRYDPVKTDVWAIGVTLYAMLAGQLPYQHQNTDRLYKIIQNGQFEDIHQLPTYLKLLIRSMIEPNPNLRASISEIKQNLWIKDKLKKSITCAKVNRLQSEWDQQLLSQLSQTYKKSQSQLIKILQNSSINSLSIQTQIRTHYFLKKFKREDNQQKDKFKQQYQTHEGGFHMKYVFKTMYAIQQFVEKHNSQHEESQQQVQSICKFQWISKAILRYFDTNNQNCLVSIKKLKNLPNLLYFQYQQ